MFLVGFYCLSSARGWPLDPSGEGGYLFWPAWIATGMYLSFFLSCVPFSLRLLILLGRVFFSGGRFPQGEGKYIYSDENDWWLAWCASRGIKVCRGGFLPERDGYAFTYGTVQAVVAKRIEFEAIYNWRDCAGEITVHLHTISTCSLATCTFPKFSIVGCPLQ